MMQELFETPPTWWRSLANLTDWLNWDAWAAIGTVGAALWAIQTWRHALADGRRREAALIQVVALGAAVAGRSLLVMHERITEGQPALDAYRALLDTQGFPATVDHLAGVPPHLLPTALVTDLHSASLAATKSSISYMRKALENPIPQVLENVAGGLAENQRSLLAYARLLEIEAIKLGGTLQDPSLNSTESVEAHIAEEEAKLLHRAKSRWHRR